MAARLTESEIETLAIERLQALGFDYIYGPDIAPDSTNPERENFAEVLLLGRLRNAATRINPTLPAAALDEAIKTIRRISSPELLANNEAFHRLLTEGVNVSYQKDGNTRGDLVWLVDFANPDNNEFLVANQVTIIENNQNKRPDLILFVNGLPLVVIELKNAADENTTLTSAYRQLETYKQAIPSLFTFNGFVVVSDGLEAKAGSISAVMSRLWLGRVLTVRRKPQHYNYYRDNYFTDLGRYGQSDPIGLAGGSMSPYVYVGANPMSFTDEDGLLFGATLGGFQRGITLRQATQIGSMGNAALRAGGATAAAGAAAATAATGAPEAATAACRIVPKLKKPCENAILAFALGTGICNGDPADDYIQDLERKESIRRGTELTGQKKIGNQQQRP